MNRDISEKKSYLLNEVTAKLFLWIGITLLVVLITLFVILFFLPGNDPIQSETIDHLGGILGGLVGTIFTLSSIILFYIALVEQRKVSELSQESLGAQMESLKLQTYEFKLQRSELKQTRDIFKEQAKTQLLQQFESTYFSMLNLHHQIVNNIDILSGGNKTLISRDCFKEFYEKFCSYYEDYKTKMIKSESTYDEAIVINKAYLEFFSIYQSDLGHYFRNLYNVLKFIKKKNQGDENFYANLLKAQLSAYELLMLFYNCLSELGNEKFKPLLEYYHFLENMPKENLIEKNSHLLLYNKQAFEKN